MPHQEKVREEIKIQYGAATCICILHFVNLFGEGNFNFYDGQVRNFKN